MLAVFILVTSRYKKNDSKELTKFSPRNERKLLWLYPTCYFIIDQICRTRLGKKLYKKISEYMLKLFIRDNPNIKTRLYCCKQLSSILILILAFNGIMLLLNVTKTSKLINSYYIKRPSYGETEQEVPVVVNMGEEEERVSIPLKERHYTDKEAVDKIFRQAKEYLDKVVLKNNKGYEHIETELYLPSSINALNVLIKWKLDEQRIIQPDGKIKIQDVAEYQDGILVTITAIIKYYDQEEYYPIILDIYPHQLTQKESILNKLKEMIIETQDNDPEKEYLQLPSQIDQQSLNYKEPEAKDNMIFNILGVAATGCIICGSYTQLKKENIKREKQMLLDYPAIINKIVLLVGAGMTVKNSWEKICMKYEESIRVDTSVIKSNKEKSIGRWKKKHSQKSKRYAYEEMLATYYDLSNGVSEIEAYDYFGRRIQLVPYMKLSSLLTQNIKKGPADLLRSLEYEAIQSIEDRKELAKKLGEEVGTKLLVPMILMLGIVLVVLMVPAFLQM